MRRRGAQRRVLPDPAHRAAAPGATLKGNCPLAGRRAPGYGAPVIMTLPTGLSAALGSGVRITADEVSETFAPASSALAAELETALGRAGFYSGQADGYPPPTTRLDAPPPKHPPAITPIRDLWLASFTPGWRGYRSDVHADVHFPWANPELAAAEGNDWLSTEDTPVNRAAIEEIRPGDLVIVQRSDPRDDKGLRLPDWGATSLLVGAAIAGPAEAWTDAKGRRQRRVHLIPATRFTDLVPRTTAKSFGRVTGGVFEKRPQRQNGTGGRGRTLSAVPGAGAVDLLAVCGIHPDALTEPDLPTLIARLRATKTGSKELLEYRYDHVLQNNRRRANEQRAVAACRAELAARQLIERDDLQLCGGEGCDLLAVDVAGAEVRIEIKGYTSKRLADVHLQPSQAQAARDVAARRTNDWWLYALLDVESARPKSAWHSADDVATLLATGGIQERGAHSRLRAAGQL